MSPQEQWIFAGISIIMILFTMKSQIKLKNVMNDNIEEFYNLNVKLSFSIEFSSESIFIE